jgi:KaiC/GvpD/RAD55 family RecA-like ATPase
MPKAGNVKNAEKDQEKRKELGTEISLAVEKLVKEKLGLLEDAVLLGDKVYRKPSPEEAEAYLRDRAIPHVDAKTTLEKSDVELGENFNYAVELQNIGKAPIFLSRAEEIIPNGLELVAHPEACDVVNTSLNMHGRKLDPYAAESFGITLRAGRKGTFIIAPRIWFIGETGRETSCKPDPASINVSETILPGRVSTGFQDLDNLLFGGIPRNYAVVLTSPSCDERDLLIRRYLEAGAENDEVTFYITIDATGVRNLAQEFQANFYVFLCNPKLEEVFENLSNVFKVGGVENLTEMNISLESAFRKLNKPDDRGRRVLIEILSDVLLQHRAVQTRKWLAGLIPEFRSRGFITLAVMNPYMHPSEETHAVLDLFEGEISVYEKEPRKDLMKYLRIKRMYNQRYLESELPLRKTRLMTTPAKLPCCTRVPSV